MSMDMMATERVCYVHCNFCNTILAVQPSILLYYFSLSLSMLYSKLFVMPCLSSADLAVSVLYYMYTFLFGDLVKAVLELL